MPLHSPPPSNEFGLVFDARRRRTVAVLHPQAQPVQTWEWDATDWQQRATAAVPPGPADPVMPDATAYDESRGVVVTCTSPAIELQRYNAGETWEYGPVAPAAAEPFGTSTCSGPLGPLTLAVDRLPWLGDTISASFGRSSSAGKALLWIGFSRTISGAYALPLDLAAMGAPLCSLDASIDLLFFGALDGQGFGKFSLAVPGTAALAGLEVYAQALAAEPVANPAGALLSNALRLRLGAR